MHINLDKLEGRMVYIAPFKLLKYIDGQLFLQGVRDVTLLEIQLYRYACGKIEMHICMHITTVLSMYIYAFLFCQIILYW